MVVPTLLVACVVGMAYAKLPQPVMDDAAKAKAAEAKAKAAEATKKAREQEE
jgi:Tfp pilus assembly protein PilO